MSIETIRDEIIKYSDLVFKGNLEKAEEQLERVMMLVKISQKDAVITELKTALEGLEK